MNKQTKDTSLTTIGFISFDYFKEWYRQEIISDDIPEIENLIFRASSEVIAMANQNNLIKDYRDNLITQEDRYFIDIITAEITAKFYDMGVDKATTSTSSTFGSKSETYSFDNDNQLQERVYNLLGKTKYYTSETYETAYIMEGLDDEVVVEDTPTLYTFKTGEEVNNVNIDKTEIEGGTPTLITSLKVDEKIAAAIDPLADEIAALENDITEIDNEIIVINENINNLYSIVAQTGEKQITATIPPGIAVEGVKTKITYNIVDNEFDTDITYNAGNFTNNTSDPITLYLVLDAFFDNSNTQSKIMNLYVDNITSATTIATAAATITDAGIVKAIAKITIPASTTIATYYQTDAATGTLTLTQGSLTMTGGTPIVVQLENYVKYSDYEDWQQVILIKGRGDLANEQLRIQGYASSSSGRPHFRISKSIDSGQTWSADLTLSTINSEDIINKKYVDDTIATEIGNLRKQIMKGVEKDER